MSYSRAAKVTVLSDAQTVNPRPNRKMYLALLAGGVLVALFVGSGLKLWQYHQSSQGETPPETDGSLAATEDMTAGPATPTEGTEPFTTPFLAATPSVALANPALLQSTSSQTHIPTVMAGRPDPFAPLMAPPSPPGQPAPALVPAPPPPPMAMPAVPVPARPTASPSRPSPSRSSPVAPVAAIQSLPPLPTVTVTSTPAPLPMPSAVAPSSTPAQPPSAVGPSPVDQILISGVVQIGQQVHAIVSEPGNASGRRVVQGDMVAGGQVRIKAIDLSSASPTVILTYNGRDYYRTVGSATAL